VCAHYRKINQSINVTPVSINQCYTKIEVRPRLLLPYPSSMHHELS
jgi:hypothetical protein